MGARIDSIHKKRTMKDQYEVEITATIKRLPTGYLNKTTQIASRIQIGETISDVKRMENEARAKIAESICKRIFYDCDLVVDWDEHKNERDLCVDLIGRLKIVLPGNLEPEKLAAISNWRLGL
jgi:hypothetical protein